MYRLRTGLPGRLYLIILHQNGQMAMHSLPRDPERLGRNFRNIIRMFLDLRQDVLPDFLTRSFFQVVFSFVNAGGRVCQQ